VAAYLAKISDRDLTKALSADEARRVRDRVRALTTIDEALASDDAKFRSAM